MKRSPIRARWRSFRTQPRWTQVVIAVCAVPVVVFVAFLLYALIAIALFGI